jgi:hypothetical protein
MKYTQELFEEIWRYREEHIYPSLFGNESKGIAPIPFERLQIGKVTDPRWNTCGVFQFAPTPSRKSWLYVSSGLSNEWFEDEFSEDQVSGFGCEFLIETPSEAEWPIHRLHQLMTYQIGLCVGVYEGSDPLTYGHRIPLGSPINFANSLITHVVLTQPPGHPVTLRQQSGVADFLQAVGITTAEVEFARGSRHEALIERLVESTDYPLSDPERASVV